MTRAHHAVDRKPAAGLEGPHGRFGFRAEDAVDFDSAEGPLKELDLPAFAAGG